MLIFCQIIEIYHGFTAYLPCIYLRNCSSYRNGRFECNREKKKRPIAQPALAVSIYYLVLLYVSIFLSIRDIHVLHLTSDLFIITLLSTKLNPAATEGK